MKRLPDIKTKRIAIKLRPSAEKQVKKGHPWIFSDSIVKGDIDGNAGDIAVIFDSKSNKFLACGLYDPDSPIRIKILQHHVAKEINYDWFYDRIKTARNLRVKHFDKETTSLRLVFGENDGLPGLIVDQYENVLVVKLYSLIWAPYLNFVLQCLVELSDCRSIVLRLGRNTVKGYRSVGLHDGQVIHGNLNNEDVLFKEHGLTFQANVIDGHKTGFFLDHRHNRKRVGDLAKNKRVLDVFCYAGGFSVHAMNGGAREVASIDVSEQALELAKRNMTLNGLGDNGKHKTIVGDAFRELDKLVSNKRKYDLVVIDPPSFAKSKKEISKALFQYERLAKMGEQLTAPNGVLVLASCSSRISAHDFYELNMQVISASGRFVQLIDQTQHDVDHPIGFDEGAYLKCGYYQFFD